MMSIEPLSTKELIKYFQVYRDAFPDWKVEHKVMLTRRAGPLTQQIDFHALRSGDYRPSCCIHVAGPPDGAQLLDRFLDVKHREISRREHDTKWRSVLRAMETQFTPNIRNPLDIEQVLRLAEDEAERDGIRHIRYMNGLATLNVFVGTMDRALRWCDRAEAWLDAIGRAPVKWEVEQLNFTQHLRAAINRGKALDFLAAKK